MEFIGCCWEPEQARSDGSQHGNHRDNYSKWLLKGEACAVHGLTQAICTNGCSKDEPCAPNQGCWTWPRANGIRCARRCDHHDGLEDCKKETNDAHGYCKCNWSKTIAAKQCEQTSNNQTSGNPDRCHARAARMNEQHSNWRKIWVAQTMFARTNKEAHRLREPLQAPRREENNWSKNRNCEAHQQRLCSDAFTTPSHNTKSNRKYQCDQPEQWDRCNQH